MAVFVLAATILMQLSAVGLALRLIRPSGARTAWLLIASAIGLILVPRIVTFIGALSGDDPRAPDLAEELVALAISALAIAGIAMIGPVFASIRRTSLALQENIERLNAFIKGCPIGVAMLDRSLTYIVVSDRWTLEYGGSRSKLEGSNHREVFPGYPERWTAAYRRVLEGNVELCEDETLPHPGGGRRRLRCEAHPWRDAHGVIGGMVLFTEDVTARKKAEEELRHAEENLRQAQKIEAVGRLAGGVAHDFNNLLTVILGFCDLAMARLTQDHPLLGELKEIQRAGKRASQLTRQLLAFSRRQVLVPKVLDLNAIIVDVDKMLQRLIGEHIEVVTKTQPDLGVVKADPGQIEQIVMNLALNARDAMPQGGRLTIETGNVSLDDSYARTHPDARAGAYVMIAVSDTGIGMDKETQAKIFEPFFTTKDRGKGTGLGLATVHGIVAQSGGNIWVYSEPGRGSTFKVYLPRVEDQAVTYQSGVFKTPPKGGSETVLVVEDEEAVRTLISRVLKSGGYRVVTARNGAEALEIQRSSPGPIQIMITDIVMPGMSGHELAGKMTAARPGLKVIYMSGYTEGALLRQFDLDKGFAFLPKPFTADSLLRTVRESIDGD